MSGDMAALKTGRGKKRVLDEGSLWEQSGPENSIIITNTRTKNQLPLSSHSGHAAGSEGLQGGVLAPTMQLSSFVVIPKCCVCVCVTVVPSWAWSRPGDSTLPIELWETKVCCNVFTIPVGSLVLLSLNDQFPQLMHG